MSRTVLHFAGCRLDIAARALSREGVRVDLPPIVFDCIAYLIAHRDRAVGRDELVAAVWGKSAISDTMLGKAILAARRAIGDSAEAQGMIRTIPRFGYHWVGAVREAPADADDEAAPETLRVQPARRRSWWQSAAIALLALIALAAGWFRHRVPAPPPDIADVSVVLPVEVVAGDDDAWLRLGLMDLIANRLRAADLPVMSSDSVVSLLKQNGADAANLEQSLRRANPTARLIQVSVAKNGGEWILHAEIDDANGAPRRVDARASDAVAVARAGSDRLLDLFGRRAPGTTSQRTDDLPLEELMQRTEAARLSDDLDTARSLLDNAPPALQALPQTRLRRAQIELRAGRADDARGRLESLLIDVTTEDDPVLRARVLTTLCNAQGRLGHQTDAIATCGDAITLASAHDATEPLAMAYNNRAITYARRREFAQAEADFSRARVAFERTGDVLALVRLDGNEASAAMGRGRPAEALPILERAGRRFDQLGIPSESLIAITNEIDAYRALLEPAKALAASEHGWSLLSRVEDRDLKHHFKRERADALAANGRLAEAHALLDELIGDIDAANEAATLALARASQASLELDSGQNEIASVLASQAIGALPSPEYDATRGDASLTEIRALHRLGRGDDVSALAKMIAWADTAKTPVAIVYAELAAAESADRPAAADAHFERASAAAADTSLPYLTKTVAISYGESLIARGELERAAIVVGRVSRYAETDYASALLQTRLYRALGERAPWEAALARARGLAGERRIPAPLTDFAVSAGFVGMPPNPPRTAAEQ